MKQQEHKGEPDRLSATSNSGENILPPVMEIDLSEFLHFLDDTHLSDKEKMECLEIHWRIICDLMSLGFGIHPVQQAQNACGKDAEPPTQQTFEGSEMLELGHSEIIKTFGKSADDRVGERTTK